MSGFGSGFGVKVFHHFNDAVEPQGDATFDWSAKGIGWGQFRFYYYKDVLYCDNEMMSKEFIKKALCQMVDNCTLTDEVLVQYRDVPSDGVGGEIPNLADSGSTPLRGSKE